jgi:hypothetical protein
MDMENKLDLDEFERLSGLAFTRYAVKMKDFIVDDLFLKYFVKKKNQMDDLHLELALFWLGKSGSLSAYQEMANFIDHPNHTFRFLTIGFIVEMKPEVDSRIMSRVIEVLERNRFPRDKQALTSVLKKLATEEAHAVAIQYLNDQSLA